MAPWRFTVLLLLLWAIGLFMRVPVLAMPPLASFAAAEYGLTQIGIGALTMIPVAVFAIGALPAAWVTVRLGPRLAIALGLLCSAMLSAARGMGDTAVLLFASSVGMGIGIAVLQTAMPVATKAWAPARAGLASTVYLNGMMVGELAGAGLTLPVVLPLAGGDWAAALLVWALPAFGLGLAVLLRRRDASQSSDSVWRPRLSGRPVLSLGAALAVAVAAFFVVNAYLETVLSSRDEDEMVPTLYLAYNVMPLLASMAVVLSGNRYLGQTRPIVCSGTVACLGLALFSVASGTAAFIGALIVGFMASVQLILLMTVPPLIARGDEVARLTSGMIFVGYGTAFFLPLLGGYLFEEFQSPIWIVAPTLAFGTISLLLRPELVGNGAQRKKGK